MDGRSFWCRGGELLGSVAGLVLKYVFVKDDGVEGTYDGGV